MLRHVKDIPAQFRRTNKPPPTKSSFFVAQILKPLSAFVARWGDMLGEQDCRVIVEEVCAVVAAEYATTAEAVLVNLKNVEESLKWLQQQKKKRPEGVAGTDAVTMSDEDMARLQMHLDSEAFGREVGQSFCCVVAPIIDDATHSSGVLARTQTPWTHTEDWSKRRCFWDPVKLALLQRQQWRAFRFNTSHSCC